MSAAAILLVAAGGAAGSLVRYAAGKLAAARFGQGRHGTLLVNLTGAFALGLLYGIEWPAKHEALYLLAGTGFLGGLTTFSTLAAQLAELVRRREYRALCAYGIWTFAGGTLLAAAGYAAGALLGT